MNINDILIRIVFAIIASGLIGYERELRNRPAGFRTHILVCVGATIVALIQMQLINDTIIMIEGNPVLASSLKADIGRVIAQVVTGVGFLGAGTIIFHNGSVKGLTTATSLWVVACLGLAIGLGYYIISIISTLAILFVVVSLKKIEDVAKMKSSSIHLKIKYKNSADKVITEIIENINKNGGNIINIKIHKDTDDISFCQLDFYMKTKHKSEIIIEKLRKNEDIISVEQHNDLPKITL